MERSITNNLSDRIGEEVLVKGWLNSLRIMGKVNFLSLRDRGGTVQVVIENKEELQKVKHLQPGSVLSIKAEVKPSNQVENGFELINPTITIDVAVTDPLPIEYNKPELKADMETILDYRPLTLRNSKINAIFKIQATIVKSYRDFLTERGFTEFFGPNIISASSEGGTELFTVNYFHNEAKLSQSAQLYKQMMVGVYERVFAVMKCFRAEKSNTRRHLTEATQFEFEMGFIEDFTEIMDILEEILKYIITEVQKNNSKELKELGKELVSAPVDVSFPRVSFREALEIYFKRTGIDERNEIDLSPGAEKELCNYAREKFGTDFIYVTHFLTEKTAFYAHPNETDPTVSNYFDLLCREAEIVSGGQRINDYQMLAESLRSKGLDPNDFGDYLSIFKYGMPKHGGFGMGMERLTMLLLGLENIREATLFPSDPKRIASVRLSRNISKDFDLVTAVREFFNNQGVRYEYQKHEAVTTSEEASLARGTKLNEGIKAIILKGKKTGKNIMFCLPGDKRIDLAKVRELEGESFEFESPESIRSKFNIQVGGVPPLGFLINLKTYYSNEIKNQIKSNFNCGTREESITIKTTDLIKSVESEVEWC